MADSSPFQFHTCSPSPLEVNELHMNPRKFNGSDEPLSRTQAVLLLAQKSNDVCEQ